MAARRCCACCRMRARRPPSVPARGEAASAAVAAAAPAPVYVASQSSPSLQHRGCPHAGSAEQPAPYQRRAVHYCYKTGTREGLQVAAMVLLGIYGGLR
jgi:hypothetical protein